MICHDMSCKKNVGMQTDDATHETNQRLCLSFSKHIDNRAHAASSVKLPNFGCDNQSVEGMESVREDLVQLAGSDRGGVIQGYTPIHSHVQLYLVQIILIVVMCFVLGQVVKIWNQPRVIAEVRW